MSELSLLAIALGGAFGSVSRFLVAREMGRRLGDFLPYGTLAVNVLGSRCRIFRRLHHFFHFQL